MGKGIETGLALAQRIHPKYSPVFEKLDKLDHAGVALYFLPHALKKALLEVTLPRVVKWYCPFPDALTRIGCRRTLYTTELSDSKRLTSNAPLLGSEVSRVSAEVYVKAAERPAAFGTQRSLVQIQSPRLFLSTFLQTT